MNTKLRKLGLLLSVLIWTGACSDDGNSRQEGQPDSEPGGIPACLGDPLCPTVMTVGHRGVAFFLPENTGPAYAHALSHGADIVETDVRAAADNTFVVFHDSTVDRITGGSGDVVGMTVEELKALALPTDDLAVKSMGSLTIRYRPLANVPEPQQILTLDELFELVDRQGIIYVDFKAGDLAALAELVRDRGLQDYVYVAARNLDQARTLAAVPGTAVMADPPDMEDLDEFLKLGPVLVELSLEEATPEVVEQIHRAGVKIMMNALNEMDLLLRFEILLSLRMIEPFPFLLTFLSELIPHGILRVQDGVFDPMDPDILVPLASRIDEVYGQLVEAGADVIQTDFLDLLVPFVQRINQERSHHHP